MDNSDFVRTLIETYTTCGRPLLSDAIDEKRAARFLQHVLLSESRFSAYIRLLSQALKTAGVLSRVCDCTWYGCPTPIHAIVRCGFEALPDGEEYDALAALALNLPALATLHSAILESQHLPGTAREWRVLAVANPEARKAFRDLQNRLPISQEAWTCAIRLARRFAAGIRRPLNKDRLYENDRFRVGVDVQCVASATLAVREGSNEAALEKFKRGMQRLVETMHESADKDDFLSLIVHLACDIGTHEWIIRRDGMGPVLSSYRRAWFEINASIGGPTCKDRRCKSADEHQDIWKAIEGGHMEAAVGAIQLHLLAPTAAYRHELAAPLAATWNQRLRVFRELSPESLQSGCKHYTDVGYQGCVIVRSRNGESPPEWKKPHEYADVFVDTMEKDNPILFVGPFSPEALKEFSEFRKEITKTYGRRMEKHDVTESHLSELVASRMACCVAEFAEDEFADTHPIHSLFWTPMGKKAIVTFNPRQSDGAIDPHRTTFSDEHQMGQRFVASIYEKLPLVRSKTPTEFANALQKALVAAIHAQCESQYPATVRFELFNRNMFA